MQTNSSHNSNKQSKTLTPAEKSQNKQKTDSFKEQSRKLHQQIDQGFEEARRTGNWPSVN